MITKLALVLSTYAATTPLVEHPVASVTRIAAVSGMALVVLLAAAAWIGWMRRRRPMLDRVVIQYPDHNTSPRG